MNELELTNSAARLKADGFPMPLPPQPPEWQALASDIEAEYRRRRHERRALELKWRLNQRFLAGDQYCDVVGEAGEIVEGADRAGQAVYNMIAPIEETRLSKLRRALPGLTVRPQTDEAADVTAARTATKLLKSAFDAHNMPALQMEAARWAELCGCAFYKSVWDPGAGLPLGELDDGTPVREGDIAVSVAP
ncbi:MAG: hypothetical protein IKS52_12365, partial [Clostridia bacterium]|nr:hypothetical protein [Clostridia bacterium]